MLGVLKSLQILIQEAGQQEPELQRLRDGHGEGGAAWLRAELEPKSRADLRRLCAELGLPQKRDGAALRKEQLLEAIVENFSSQEGRSQGMGVERCLTLRTSCLCCSRRRQWKAALCGKGCVRGWVSAFGIQAKSLTGTGASEHGGRFRDL